MNYYSMGMPIPDWIWLDIHSLYKLSTKIKKSAMQIATDALTRSRNSSPLSCYLQILLLNLADPTGLMQEEIKLVYDFAESLVPLIELQPQPVALQAKQCLVLIEEDSPPYFLDAGDPVKSDSARLYIDFRKLYSAFDQNKILPNVTQSRFSRMHSKKNANDKPTVELLAYLRQRWSGISFESAPLFEDRLDRFVAIGLTSTYKLQQSEIAGDIDLEFMVHSVSNRLLSCVFNTPSVLSIGSLISFRKADMAVNRRSLGVVDKLIVEKEQGKLNFGVKMLTENSITANYVGLGADTSEMPKKALFYNSKDRDGKSYLIIDTFIVKEGETIRLFINNEDFIVVLKNKRNIGLGYWQFECYRQA